LLHLAAAACCYGTVTTLFPAAVFPVVVHQVLQLVHLFLLLVFFRHTILDDEFFTHFGEVFVKPPALTVEFLSFLVKLQ